MNKPKALILNNICTTPNYYNTWQTQLYICNNNGPVAQRENMTEENIFGNKKGQGWINFFEDIRNNLVFVLDDMWDVPKDNNNDYFGSLVLDKEKFPSFAGESISNQQALLNLSQKVKEYGWKGLGCWICAQESPIYSKGKSVEEYWKQRIIEADNAGILYWKVDWGTRDKDYSFRKMLTDLSHKYAKNLIIENAMTIDNLSVTDVYRSYDVMSIMSIPMTMEKLKELLPNDAENDYMGLVNCEDEMYIAAALGLTIGVQRHPMVGSLPNNNPDCAFPALHRNIKTKMQEITRAINWHKIAPAFKVESKGTIISTKNLTDTWCVQDQPSEIEAWWKYKNGDTIETKAPSYIVRGGLTPPAVTANENGDIPYIVASKNPNGAVSIATLGRTVKRDWFNPLCDVSLDIQDADTVGIFGYYKTLTLTSDNQINCIFAQDLGGGEVYDITSQVSINSNQIKIDGNLIHKIGTSTNSQSDTSEPGIVILIK